MGEFGPGPGTVVRQHAGFHHAADDGLSEPSDGRQESALGFNRPLRRPLYPAAPWCSPVAIRPRSPQDGPGNVWGKRSGGGGGWGVGGRGGRAELSIPG